MMLGYLLARAGVKVLVLEKHGDFLRDFRGDTIHPSTLEVMHELGLLEEFLKLPHQKVYELNAQFGRRAADDSGFPPSAGPLRLYRFHAAMGFSQLYCRESGALSEFRSQDGSGGY